MPDERIRIAVAPFRGAETLRPALERLSAQGLAPGDLTVLTRQATPRLDDELSGLAAYLVELDGLGRPGRGGSAQHTNARHEALFKHREALIRSMLHGPARLTEDWNEKWTTVDYLLLVTIPADGAERGIQRILLDHAVDRVELHEVDLDGNA